VDARDRDDALELVREWVDSLGAQALELGAAVIDRLGHGGQSMEESSAPSPQPPGSRAHAAASAEAFAAQLSMPSSV
jgi:hypothetical protein